MSTHLPPPSHMPDYIPARTADQAPAYMPNYIPDISRRRPRRSSGNTGLALFAGIAAAAVVGAGIGATQNAGQNREVPHQPDTIGECYDSPVSALHDTPRQLGNMALNIRDNRVQGDPISLPKAVQEKVAGAIVSIASFDKRTGFESQGSGFLTTDAAGDPVVVTAAHVLASETPQDTVITDNEGRSSLATGGCYILQQDTKRKSLSALQAEMREATAEGKESSSTANIDLAVLKLATPIGRTTLNFASQETSRGQWDYFMNYQMGTRVGAPDSYTGLDLTCSPAAECYSLTGTHLPTGNALSHVRPGASGGVVVNGNGDIIGMSYAMLNLSTPDTIATLSTFDTTVSEATIANTGLDLRIASLIPEDPIEQALLSPWA